MIRNYTPSAATSLIRTATRHDLEAIGDLWVELMTFHSQLDPRFSIPPQGRANYIHHSMLALRDSNYRILVAEDHQQVVGYLMAYIAQNPPIFPFPTYGFIADICVTHSARRNGFGEQLVKEISSWFRSRGMSNIQLNVAYHNPVSQAFWRKMGCTDYLQHMWVSL